MIEEQNRLNNLTERSPRKAREVRMLDKVHMKDENHAVIYFTHRSPVNVYSDCGNVLELVAVLLGPSPKESRVMDTYDNSEHDNVVEFPRPRGCEVDDDPTEIIEMEDIV